jgi:hypothetical protein
METYCCGRMMQLTPSPGRLTRKPLYTTAWLASKAGMAAPIAPPLRK